MKYSNRTRKKGTFPFWEQKIMCFRRDICRGSELNKMGRRMKKKRIGMNKESN